MERKASFSCHFLKSCWVYRYNQWVNRFSFNPVTRNSRDFLTSWPITYSRCDPINPWLFEINWFLRISYFLWTLNYCGKLELFVAFLTDSDLRILKATHDRSQWKTESQILVNCRSKSALQTLPLKFWRVLGKRDRLRILKELRCFKNYELNPWWMRMDKHSYTSSQRSHYRVQNWPWLWN